MELQGFRDLEKSRLSRRVAEQLKRAIHEGRCLPGERLSSERDLSQRLGISRPVLREALNILEVQKLVTIRRGHGTFVTNVAAELFDVEPMEWLAANKTLVDEFYEARLIIEPQCAALASQRATPSDISTLKDIITHADQILTDGEVAAFVGLDVDFHSAVAKASGNPFLSQMLSAAINPNTDIRKVLHRVSGHLSLARNRHVRIIEAIEAREPERAREEMTRALEGASQDVLRFLERGAVAV